MSKYFKGRYKNPKGHYWRESAVNRRDENRRRRHENNHRVRLGLEPKRFRGTESMMTW